MEKIYLASHFKKIEKDGKLSFKDDFRVDLIGSEEKFVNFNRDSYLHNKDGKAIYQYMGPFYNEEASTGDLTSNICEEVVRTESKLINESDVFAVYFDKDYSLGSVSELIYAAFKGKKIIIFYEEEDNEFTVKSSNWYPIVSARQILEENKKDCIEVHCVKGDEEVKEYFQNKN